MQTRLDINKTPDKENYIFIATHKGGEELVKAFLDEYTNETGLTIKHIEEKEVSVSRVFWFATKKQKEIEYEIDVEVIVSGVFNSIKDENGNIIPKQKDLHKIIEISRNRHLAFQDIKKQQEDIDENQKNNFSNER